MPARYRLELSPQQREELTHARDHHALPSVRPKAAALLKIADGWPISRVAQSGLLKPVSRHRVKAWITSYQQEGLAGLLVHPGRGRKPVFSPCLRRSGPVRRRPARAAAP
jgi:hypothetical protein